MPLIKLETEINADIKTCFDVARSVDVHQESLKLSEEKAVSGKISGLMEKGEWVSWEVKRFGLVQHLSFKITEFDAPNYFVDEMVYGGLKFFRHKHIFSEKKGKTIMVDEYDYTARYKIFGKILNALFLKKYLENRLKTRNRFVKEKAESIAVQKNR